MVRCFAFRFVIVTLCLWNVAFKENLPQKSAALWGITSSNTLGNNSISNKESGLELNSPSSLCRIRLCGVTLIFLQGSIKWAGIEFSGSLLVCLNRFTLKTRWQKVELCTSDTEGNRTTLLCTLVCHLSDLICLSSVLCLPYGFYCTWVQTEAEQKSIIQSQKQLTVSAFTWTFIHIG